MILNKEIYLKEFRFVFLAFACFYLLINYKITFHCLTYEYLNQLIHKKSCEFYQDD